MDLSRTEQQQALAGHVSGFFEKECPSARVRAAEPLGFDGDLWRQVVTFGLPAMAVPEEHGGGGASLEDVGIVAVEYGRRLAPVPLVETIVANNLLERLASADRSASAPAELLRQALDGAVTTLTVAPVTNGVAGAVPAGAVAEVVLTLRGDEVLALRDGTPPRPSPPNLGASPIADWHPGGCECTVVARGDEAVAIYERALHEWRAINALALVGLAQAALDLGVGYVKQRRAFGVVVGSFQSVQHRLADAATAIEGAELLGFEALWALDTHLSRAAALASMAFLFAAEHAFAACSESLQFHGGYGYTLEYDIQLYFRRAKAWPLVLGDPRREYRRLAALLFEGQD